MENNTRFISDYVNTIYAIIMGFGFVEITKDLISSGIPFSLNPNKEIFIKEVMGLFVIIVISLYWWDWSKNFDNKVKSTFPEFIIDLGILFTLQIMLFNFADPLALAKLLIVLSFLDILWVLNYIREHLEVSRLPLNKSNFLKKLKKIRLKWMGEKVLALLLYSLSCYLISKISENTWIIPNQRFTNLIILFISFFLVRRCCFKNKMLL